MNELGNWLINKNYPSTFTDLDYADDAVLFTDCQSKWPDILSHFDTAAQTLQKTKVQNVGYGPAPSPVNVQGQPVEVTDQFTYLGNAMSSSGRSAPGNTSANQTCVKHNVCEYLETGKVVSVHKAAAVQCLCRLCPSARCRDLDTAEIRRTEARGIQHVMPATYIYSESAGTTSSPTPPS